MADILLIGIQSARKGSNVLTPDEAAEVNQRCEAALDVASRFGGIDGEHHKTRVIDQMVRALCGTPEVYAEWVRLQKAGEDGPETYSWDEGIAP